jgi:hypothetical protein
MPHYRIMAELECPLFPSRGASSAHHRTSVVMYHQPLIPNPLKEIRREHARLLGFIGLLARDVFDADDPGHVAGNLDHDLGEFKFH